MHDAGLAGSVERYVAWVGYLRFGNGWFFVNGVWLEGAKVLFNALE